MGSTDRRDHARPLETRMRTNRQCMAMDRPPRQPVGRRQGGVAAWRGRPERAREWATKHATFRAACAAAAPPSTRVRTGSRRNTQGKLPKRARAGARGLAGYRMALTAPRLSAACSCSPFRCRRFFLRSFAPAALLLAELRRSANLKALEAPGGLFFWSCHLHAAVGAEIATISGGDAAQIIEGGHAAQISNCR